MLLLWFSLFIFLPFIKGNCPNGSVSYYYDESMCFSFHSQKRNYIDAEGICIGLRGHLASVHNMFENMFIYEKAASNFTESSNEDFWSGANTVLNPGIWSWMDYSAFNFTDWEKGQPQNTSGSNCGSVRIQGGLWVAEDCDLEKPFVCLTKIPSSTTAVLKTTTTTAKTNACPTGWAFWNYTGACYGVYENSNWLDAEGFCQNKGGHLVSIHSNEEDRFVADLAYYPGANVCDGTKQAWIGLYTEDKGTHWNWTDQTPFDYQNWSSGYPLLGGSTCSDIILAPVCGNDIGYISNWPLCHYVLSRFICKKML